MSTSYGALCSDFYINQKIAFKMDLPKKRDTVLHFFDQVKKAVPDLTQFNKFENELYIESQAKDSQYLWLALRKNSIRSGHVNPESMHDGYHIHEVIHDIAPYCLSLSPIDVDYIEVMFGFDLECSVNQDQVVFDALYAETPLAKLTDIPNCQISDTQPLFGINLDPFGKTQAFYEIKTRSESVHGPSNPVTRSKSINEPLSIYLTVRRYNPIQKIEEFENVFNELTHHANLIAVQNLVPGLLKPIAQTITSQSQGGFNNPSDGYEDNIDF